MRRTKAQHISDVLQVYLRAQGLETPLNQHRLIEAWPQVMGPAIARYTGKVFIQNQTLHVEILSGPLKQDLLMNRAALVRKLNEHVGAQVIAQIHFY